MLRIRTFCKVGEEKMSVKEKSIFGNDFQKVCYGNIIARTIAIPTALISAKLLSSVVKQATFGQITGVIHNAAILLVLVILMVVFQSGVNIILRKEEVKALQRSKMHFLEKFLENSLDKLFRTDYGELIENITDDMEKVTNRYMKLYPFIISSFLGMIGYFLFLVLQSPIVAGTLFIISFIQFFPPLIVKKYMKISYEQCEEIEAGITKHVVEAVEGFDIIKLYGLKGWWQQKMSDYHRNYISVGRKADAVAAAQRSMYRLLDNILKFGTYALIGLYVIGGYCSMEVAVGAIYLSQKFYGYVQSLFSTIPEMAVSQSAEKRIGKWIHKEEKLSDTVISNAAGIQIREVSYGYDTRELLNRIRYQFQNNKNYLLKGNNGTGKTTLLNILSGLILPDNGEIYVENKAGDFLRKKPDSSLLFYIPQQDPKYQYNVSTLFTMFGEEKQERLTQIAEKFNLTEIIEKGTAICELSGGERKKVFLTIGFAMEPRWLLLDEPSNNLDSDGKRILTDLVKERRATILISHDMIFEDIVDCVIELENGRIYDANKKEKL